MIPMYLANYRDGAASLSAVALLPLVTFFLWRSTPGVLNENQLVESAQAAFLVVAAGLNFWLARRNVARGSVNLFYHAVVGLLCVSLFAREVDIDRLGSAMIWPAVEIVFRGFLLALWIVACLWLWRGRTVIWAQGREVLFNPQSWLIYAAGALYVASWFFDKRIVPLETEPSLFIEETVQLQAAALLALGPALRLGVGSVEKVGS